MLNQPGTLTDALKKHKAKIIHGSGVAVILGQLAVSGLQYQENSALTIALNTTQASLTTMGERYERLVQVCLDKVDDDGKPKG